VSRLRSVELRRGKQVSGVRRRKAQGARHKAQFLHCPPFLKGGWGDFTTPLLQYSITPNHNQKLWERLSPPASPERPVRLG